MWYYLSEHGSYFFIHSMSGEFRGKLYVLPRLFCKQQNYYESHLRCILKLRNAEFLALIGYAFP